ncbi:MAG: restriction endonuclease subunit S [Ruminococcus sp.]|nr:restriction endonuclease subunit S [Ruminococcus sp.]
MCYIKARIGWQRLTKSEYRENGDYYLVTGTDIKGSTVDFSKCWYVDKERYEMDENIQLKNGDIIVTKDGTIGKVAMIQNMDKPAVLNSHLFVIRDTSSKLNNRFLMYILLSKHFKRFIIANQSQGTIPGLNQEKIIKFKIPIPPIKEQERIVSILDRFDKLCNDISEGLPAEIEARRKQYEYYRDKLLSFKEQ